MTSFTHTGIPHYFKRKAKKYIVKAENRTHNSVTTTGELTLINIATHITYLTYLYLWHLYLCLRFCISMCFSEGRQYPKF